MQVFRVAISPQSLFNRAFKPIDYTDAWQVSIQSKKDIQVEDVLLAFQPPIWAAWLLRLRDAIVGFFGLKKVNATRGEQSIATLKAGDSLGFFKVFGRSDQELLLGENDTHLDFRVSFSLADQINPPRVKPFND